jgi:predicted transcriptional regulator YdeE
VGGDIFALYTQYEEDYTKPYTYVLGCEVSSLDQIPKGMMGIEISPTPYAVFTARGAFPASLGSTWQSIWETPIERAYSVDFEIYPPTFHPESNPEVKVFIAVK